MKTIKWHTETRKLSDLIPADYNPRKISEQQATKLKKSLDRFGYVETVDINLDNTVIGGHQRLKALADLGYDEIDVRVPDCLLTKKEEQTLNISLNEIRGEFDNEKIVLLDQDVVEDGGFPPDKLNEIFSQPQVAVVEDEIPELEEIEPTAKLGDLYQLGRHRLLCGDCTVKENVELLMDGNKSILLHADPPYGMGKERDGVVNDNLYREKLDKFQMSWWLLFRDFIENNASVYIWGNTEDLWRLWYNGGLKDSERLTFRNEIVWDKQIEGNPTLRVCGATFEKDRSFTQSERCLFFMCGEQGFNNNADNYWEGFEPIRLYIESERAKIPFSDKQIANALGFKDGRSVNHWYSKSQWEFPTEENYKKLQAYVDDKTLKKEYKVLKKDYDIINKEYQALKSEFYSTRACFDSTYENMTDVWQYQRVRGEERYQHATPKPAEMIGRIIKSSSLKDSIVIEPFLGSGSTLMACEQTDRICYGMELEPMYIDVIIARWEKFTGEKAIKIN